MTARLSILFAVACLPVSPLAAQASPSRIIQCGTDSRQRVQCDAGGPVTRVRLVRDLSDRCGTPGTWGWTEKSVWTDNSCRGEFEVNYVPENVRTKRITCGTLTSNQAKCGTEGPAASVRLIRLGMFARCTQGSNWGYSDSLIWAGRGCRAEFEVTYKDEVADKDKKPTTKVIACGSVSGRLDTCRTEGRPASVRLVKELSNNRCRQGTNWDYNTTLVWAKDGCRGAFEITYDSATTTPGVRRITCGTASGDQVICKTGGPAAAVRLVRELSDNRCRQKSTWGNTDSYIWANRGCRAEFEVTYQGAAPTDTDTRRITCGNVSNAHVQCAIGGDATGVRLVRDLSGGRCRKGSSWDHTAAFIWANQGCRAEFEVSYAGSVTPKPTPTPTPAPAPAPAPTTRVITCGNASGSSMSCNAFGTVATVSLKRDRSGGACSQSSSWGLGEESIWVARKCYGDFEVTYGAVMRQF
jgi:hypothetical protein